MTAPVEFSSKEAVSLEKQIDNSITASNTNLEDIDFVYEIDKSAKWIRENNFKKVCLQFPDFLLPDSTEVAQRLQTILNQTVYVMGDTAYESCCIDYVAAAHINADAVIHYGPVCFSKPSESIPYLTIYEKYPLDLFRMKKAYDDLKELSSQFKSEIIIMLIDTPYILHLDAIKETFKGLIIRAIDDVTDLQSSTVIFIGGNRRKIINLNLSFKPKELYFYDPKSIGNERKFINYEQDTKVLKRRYFLVEKIKDSKTIGIVIGTLAVKNYLRVIERIKKLIRANGKKYYVISVGKPTVAKLANFLELDLYVIITCAMNEIYESHDFYKPIVTPFDIELALNPQTNDGSEFSYDYNSYLPDNDLNQNDLDRIKRSNSESDVSLITGKVRISKISETDTNIEDDNTQIALRSTGTVAISSNFGAGFLAERSWKGLEQDLGETEPELATEGRRGIAQGYANEKL